MGYSKINQIHIDYFSNLLGEGNLISDNRLSNYSQDHTEDLVYKPEIVLIPKSSDEVSKVSSK